MVAILVVIVIRAAYIHFKALTRIDYYAVQGMVPLPGYKTPIFGNALSIKKY